jgi:hypothetical protein
MDVRAHYDEICDDLVAQNPEVVLTQMMGMPAVKADGKLVCGFLRSQRAMVFKLPNAGEHAAALGLEGTPLRSRRQQPPFKVGGRAGGSRLRVAQARGAGARVKTDRPNVQCSGWARIAARANTIRPIAWTWKATSRDRPDAPAGAVEREIDTPGEPRPRSRRASACTSMSTARPITRLSARTSRPLLVAEDDDVLAALRTISKYRRG